jgi:hypothetical protein
VANCAAIQNPEGLPGRSPGRFGRPVGAATEPRRGEGTLLLVSMVLALAVLLQVLLFFLLARQ